MNVFKCVPKNKAIRIVRHALAVVGIRNTAAYGTHDFRRGHAYDMLVSGATLAAILFAGGWKSARSLPSYLPGEIVERKAALQAELEASDSDSGV